MTLWTVIVLSGLALPTFVFLAGLLQRKWPAKYGSRLGYCTKASQRSRETWAYAQKTQAELFNLLGLTTAAVTAAVLLVLRKSAPEHLVTARNVLMVLDVLLVLMTYIPIEAQLRRRFDERGAPRAQPCPQAEGK